MTIDREFDLDKALVIVTSRLMTRFGQQADRSVVEATVRRCAEAVREGADRRVHSGVLVERRSIECLAALVTEPNRTDPTPVVKAS